MNKQKLRSYLLGVTLVGLATLFLTAADEPAKPGEPLVVVDSAGKEVKLKTWKFNGGTRHLAWLASVDKDKEAAPKEKQPAKGGKGAPKRKASFGPEALELREQDSTKFQEGVLTLIPLERVRSVEYDDENKIVTINAATGPKDSNVTILTGETGFRGMVNKLVIESEVDKGALGLAEVKFIGGDAKGVKSIKFPVTKVEALPKGRPALLTTKKDSSGSTEHKIYDFQPVFRFADGHETLSPTLFFKKTLKIDMAKIVRITRTAGEANETVWVVSVKGAEDETLTLLKTPEINGKPTTLAGFVGRVSTGYKLIPAAIIQEVEFDVKPKID